MRSLIPKNKKGDMASILIVIVIMFILGVLVYSFMVFFNPLMNEFKGVSEISNNEKAVSAINKIQDFTPGLIDLAVVLIFLGFLSGLVISSLYIETIPGITIFFLLILIIGVFIAIQFSNVFHEFRTSPEMIEASSNLPISNILLGKMFPILILITGIIVMFVLYGKGNNPGGYQV